MIIRSLYNVSRQMNVLQKKQENNSANAANANTPGYKFQQLIHRTMQEYDLYNHAGGRDNDRRVDLGSINFGTEIDGAYTTFTQGILNETGIRTDLSISGRGFFAIELENGQMGLARNGNFKIDQQQSLVTMERNPVLGINSGGNALEIYIENDNFTVDTKGYINGSATRVMVVDYPDYGDFELLGEGVFSSGGADFEIGDGEVKQGYLEASNVNILDEIVKMMEVSREFESNQRTLRVLNDTLQKTVNEIGRN